MFIHTYYSFTRLLLFEFIVTDEIPANPERIIYILKVWITKVWKFLLFNLLNVIIQL